MSSPESKIPLWLDCDPGHDDAFAILFAAYHPHIELLGISTVHGNSSLQNTTRNAGSILTAIGRPNIPVYPGASKGLSRPAIHAPDIHGESGIDGTSLLPEPLVKPNLEKPAIDAMAEALLNTPADTAWLVATGTLTNVALLIQKYPEIPGHIKGLSMMGGAVGSNFTTATLGVIDSTTRFGNITPTAEFNIWADPESASLIFSNPILSKKSVLIPLDLTHQVLATKKVQQLILHGPSASPSGSPTTSPSTTNPSIKKTPSTLRIMLVELLYFFASTYAEKFGLTEGPPLHDPLAVAVILDGIPGWEIPFYDYEVDNTNIKTRTAEGKIKRERFHIEVITAGTHEDSVKGETEMGRTITTLVKDGEEGVKIPRTLDVERFWAVLEECLERADEVNRGE